MDVDPQLSVGQCATLACLLEATAPKPGNVHRGADFEDLTFTDFVASAVAIGPAMESARQTGVGRAVRDAIAATRRLVSTNTNLGAVLLIAPLAAVPRDQRLAEGVAAVCAALKAEDAHYVYEAIRLAAPGGLGTVREMDVSQPAPADLVAAMSLAADRDLVARQYVNGCEQVLGCVVPWLQAGQQAGWPLTTAIIHAHVRLMAEFPDSLIARKCGTATAQQSALLAQGVLAAGSPNTTAYLEALADFDFWLRCDGHRRNPGTSADLIAAGLFAALRERRIDVQTAGN